MKTTALVHSAAGSVKRDPVGALKLLLFAALALLILVVLWKFLKGISSVSDAVGDSFSTESEKQEVISSPAYQDGIKWLGDRVGIESVIRSKKFTNLDAYLVAIKTPPAALSSAAEKIWKSKVPGYISETEVYNAIAGLPTRAAVSLMAGYFNQIYKDSFGFYPLDVFLGKYLKLSEMQTLTTLINKKPAI